MNDCEQCKRFYLELERLRRLAPNGTYTLNIAHEEELARMRSLADSAAYEQGLAQRRMMEAQAARDKAQAKAADYERDWYEAKSEFGSAMAKMREALRAAEQRELVALAELDEAKCERDACRAMEKAAELRGDRLFRDRALVDETGRIAAQLLIAVVGAEGQMNVDDAAKAAVNEIYRLKMRLEQLGWGNEMACENTWNPSCECQDCETARSRAEKGEATP